MQKNFMEVFPGLKLAGEKKALFENATVLRVASTKNRDVLRIYIYCGIFKQRFFFSGKF